MISQFLRSCAFLVILSTPVAAQEQYDPKIAFPTDHTDPISFHTNSASPYTTYQRLGRTEDNARVVRKIPYLVSPNNLVYVDIYVEVLGYLGKATTKDGFCDTVLHHFVFHAIVPSQPTDPLLLGTPLDRTREVPEIVKKDDFELDLVETSSFLIKKLSVGCNEPFLDSTAFSVQERALEKPWLDFIWKIIGHYDDDKSINRIVERIDRHSYEVASE